MKKPEKLHLIIAETPVPATVNQDRGGGQLQSLPENIIKKIAEKGVDFDAAKEKLDKCITEVSQLLADIKNKAVDGWEIEGVSLGLAISAQGSIGIATAGVEASIEISFKPKK